MNEGCVFCNVINNASDKEIIRLKNSISILADNQFFKGKVIVIFNKHNEDLTALSEEEKVNFYKEMLMIASAVKKALNPDKMNYALLGNVVHHLHWHVIPRYKDDANWGTPPWPHDEVKLSEEETSDLIEKIKKEISL